MVDGVFFYPDGSISAELREHDGAPVHISETPELRLLQYTGLTDKNGVEIFEGDILADDAGVVEFAYGGFCVRGERSYIASYAGVFEVIGNIYQNPELLKDADQ
jgi:hypothetical protein